MDKRYEYKVIEMEEPNSSEHRGEGCYEINKVLNELGHDGWKLIEVTNQSYANHVYIFIRQV